MVNKNLFFITVLIMFHKPKLSAIPIYGLSRIFGECLLHEDNLNNSMPGKGLPLPLNQLIILLPGRKQNLG